MTNIKTYIQFINENYQDEFSKEVLKWSRIWTPREDCTPIEIKIINHIFTKDEISWESNLNCFSISSLNINGSSSIHNLNRLAFLPPLAVYNFNCAYNDIESLEGGPEITTKYYCHDNKLKDLRGAPLKCEDFDCEDNPLKDFKIYAEPYAEYWAPGGANLIFIDPNKWTKEEYEAQLDNMNTSDTYL